MVVSGEILDLLRDQPVKTIILLYLASRYTPEVDNYVDPSWVHIREIIEFVTSVKDVREDTIAHILYRDLFTRFNQVDRKRLSKNMVFYKINEKGLKWLRYKMFVEGKIPIELKVPAIDLVRVKLKNGVIV